MERFVPTPKWENYTFEQVNGQVIVTLNEWRGEKPDDNFEIFVGKLPRDISVKEILSLLNSVAPIYMLRLMVQFSGHNRGFAFATYTNLQDMELAIRKLDGYCIRDNWRLGVCRSVNNCWLHVESTFFSLSDLVSLILSTTKGYVEVHFRTSQQSVEALVLYESHRSAAMARKELVARVSEKRTPVTAEWASQKIMNQVNSYQFITKMSETTKICKRIPLREKTAVESNLPIPCIISPQYKSFDRKNEPSDKRPTVFQHQESFEPPPTIDWPLTDKTKNGSSFYNQTNYNNQNVGLIDKLERTTLLDDNLPSSQKQNLNFNPFSNSISNANTQLVENRDHVRLNESGSSGLGSSGQTDPLKSQNNVVGQLLAQLSDPNELFFFLADSLNINFNTFGNKNENSRFERATNSNKNLAGQIYGPENSASSTTYSPVPEGSFSNFPSTSNYEPDRNLADNALPYNPNVPVGHYMFDNSSVFNYSSMVGNSSNNAFAHGSNESANDLLTYLTNNASNSQTIFENNSLTSEEMFKLMQAKK